MKGKTLSAIVALAVGFVLVLPAALAQHPGQINMADFAVFDDITPTIEVKLDGRMLRFAGAAAKHGNHPEHMSLFQQPASDPNVCDPYNIWPRTARGLVIFVGSGLEHH